MQSTFAERLKEGLEAADMSQARLARLVGVERATINKYLHGKYKATQQNLYKIAVALDVSEAWLMGFDVEKYRVSPITLEQNELIKMYTLLDGAGRTRLLAYAYQLIEKQNGGDDDGKL